MQSLYLERNSIEIEEGCVGFLRRFKKTKTTANQPDAQSPLLDVQLFPTVTFTRTGKKVPLVLDPLKALQLVLAGEECALLIWLQDYKKIEEVMVCVAQCSLLICHNCFLNLHLSPSFMAGLTGLDKLSPNASVIVLGEDKREYGRRGRCFKCRSDKAFMVFTKTPTESL